MKAGKVKPEAVALTLAEFIEHRWWPVFPDANEHSEKTKIAAEWSLKHARRTIADLPRTKIGEEQIVSMVAELRGRKLSPKSGKDICGWLHKVLVTAKQWHIVTQVPAFPKLEVLEAEFEHLSPDECEAVISVARDDFEAAALRFAFQTGARVGEQRAFESGDIDWRRHELIIRRNRPSGTTTTGPLKNRKKGRRIPMRPELEAALKRIQHLKGTLIFCGQDGSHMEADEFTHILRRACKKAGVRYIRWHDCRHTFASQAVEAGVPLNVVKE